MSAPGPQSSSVSFYKNVLKSSTIYIAGLILQRLANIVLVPIYTHYLDPAAYGTLELLDLTVGLFGLFTGATFSNSLFYFFNRARTPEDRQSVISTSIFGAALLGCLGATLGIALAPEFSRLVFQDPARAHLFRVSFAGFAFSLPVDICYAALRAMDRPLPFTLASLGRISVTGGATLVLLVGFHWGVAAPIWGALIGAAVMSIVLVSYCLRGVPAGRLRPRPRLFWDQLCYAAPTVFAALSEMTLNTGDRYFLQRSVQLAEVGIYSLAYRGGMLVSFFQQSFQYYWASQVYAIVERPDAVDVVSRLFTYATLSLVSLAMTLSLFASPGILLLTAPAFHSAAQFVPAIAAIYIIRGVAAFFRSMLFVHRKTGLDARLNLYAAGVCLAAYAILIPRFHAWGAIVATSLGFSTQCVYFWISARRLQRFQLEYRRLLQLAGLAAADVLAVHAFTGSGVAAQFAGAAIGTAAYPALLLLTGFFTPGERAVILSTVRRLRRVLLNQSREVVPS